MLSLQIIFLIFVAVGMWKGIPLLVDASFNYQSRVAFDQIQVGSRWMSTGYDPWSGPRFITIVEKLDGWVKYRYDDSSIEFSMKAWSLVEGWKPVERIEEEV